MTDDLTPITAEDDAAAVAAVVDSHRIDPSRIRPPVKYFTADRRVVIAVSVAWACFSAAVLLVLIVFVTVIQNQSDTIGAERAARSQAEARVASLQSQVSDQNNQALCRSQVANDYESALTVHSLDADARQTYFFEALNAVSARDPDALAAALTKANQSQTVVEASGRALTAAAQARQESVAACQKASTTTTRPGG